MEHSPGFIRLVEEAKKNVQQVSVTDAAKLVRDGALLIDVREESEWLAGHAVGAMQMGRGILERDIESRVQNPESMVLLYCGGGYRSVLAVESLQKMGYRRAYSVEGGYTAWVAARLPTTTGPEKYPRSPYEKLADLYFLPRLIDKCRLAPQGKLPGYNYLTSGMDRMLLEFLCVEGRLFEQQAIDSRADGEVLAWLKMKLGPGWPGDSKIFEFNEKLKSMRPTTPERQEAFDRQRAGLRPTRRRIETYFDLIDLDEGRFVDSGQSVAPTHD